MKKLLLVFLFATLFVSVKGQIINGNIETWDNNSWNDLDSAQTSNSETVGQAAPENATKTTGADKTEGNYGVKLETIQVGNDTAFGYFLFGKFGDSGPEGGPAYTQQPTSITGKYKCNILPGDSALIIVVFFKAGAAISMNTFYIGGTQSSFTTFSFPLSLGTTPDSVLVAGASSDPMGNYTPKPGSWIIFDDIKFAGAGITQQVYNTNFEYWIVASVETPQGWTSSNLETYRNMGVYHTEKTTDSYKGSYAMILHTIWWGDTNFNTSTTNGQYNQSGPATGGAKFSNAIDTLVFWYKYFPQGNDTSNSQAAAVSLNLTKNSVNVGGNMMYLPKTTTYTKMELPFNTGINTPDTARIDFNSSEWNTVDSTCEGSALYIDEIQFKSAPLNTGINKIESVFGNRVFPNPARNYFNIEYALTAGEDVSVSIYDLTGRRVYNELFTDRNIGNHHLKVDIGSYTQGVYIYKVINSANQLLLTGKIVVE